MMATDVDARVVQAFHPGESTATPLNVAYRLGRLREIGVLRGHWLDLGCAEGDYTVALPQFGADSAVGVDMVAERIHSAKLRHAHNPLVTFACPEGDALPFPDAAFDGVFMNEVLEHVTDEITVLRELQRVLRPGGHLVIISPNRGFPFECHGGHIGRMPLRFPVPFLPWLPPRLGQRFMNARNYWPGDMRRLVERQGFQVAQVGFIWPVLEAYRWLPPRLRLLYQRHITDLDRLPGLRRLGLSVLLVARKPGVGITDGNRSGMLRENPMEGAATLNRTATCGSSAV